MKNFNSEKIGYKNSSAHELLSKKYAILGFMAKNDAKSLIGSKFDLIFRHET